MGLIHTSNSEDDVKKSALKQSLKVKNFFRTGASTASKKETDIKLLRILGRSFIPTVTFSTHQNIFCTGLEDRARGRSKYDIKELAEASSHLSECGRSRRRSTAKEPADMIGGINTSSVNSVFTSPQKQQKHLGHSSSGEIILLKTLNNSPNSSLPKYVAPCTSGVTVTVTDIKVKNLISGAYIGKANPYVVMSLAGVRLKTKVKWNENNAKWEDSIVFDEIASLRSSGTLDVKVYDKERLARKVLLGAVTLDIAGNRYVLAVIFTRHCYAVCH